MADEKIVQVTYEFQSNAETEVSRIISKMREAEVDASRAFKAMTEGSTIASRAFDEMSGEAGALSSSLGTLEGDATHAFDTIAEGSSDASQSIDEISAKTDKLPGQFKPIEDAASRAFGSITKSGSDASSGMGTLKGALGNLPGPLKSATTGIMTMVKAAMAFIATPLGAIISAIVVGLKALFSWFNSSAEGQMKFAKISGYVSGVLGQLKEIVNKIGKAIYDAFTNPQEAVKKLWEIIKTNIVNRIAGIGEMFKAIGKIITSGFTDGYSDLANATLKTATGIDHLTEKVKDYAEGVHNAAKATSDLKAAELQLSRDRSGWESRKAELEVQAEELRTAMYAASDAERLKIAKQYEDVIAEKYAKETAFLEEELRIKKELNNLTSSTQEDLDEVNKLEAALVRLKAEQTREMRPMDRQMGSLAGKELKTGPSESEKTEKQLEQQKKYQYDWEKSELAFEQRQIDLLDDSFYKQQKQLELNNRKALDEVKRQEEEVLKAKREAYGETATLSEAERSYFEQMRALVSEEYRKETETLRDNINEAFAEGRLLFADELTVQLDDIDKYYKDRIRKAEGNEELINQLILNKEKEITLAKNAYNREMLSSDLQLTKKRIENVKDYYKFTADRREAELQAEKEATEKRIKLLEEQYAVTPFEDIKKEIELAREELEGFNQELRNIPRERISETAGEFSKIIGALGGLDGEIGQLFSSLSGSFSNMSESFSADTSTMTGKADAISSAIGSIVGIIEVVISATKRRKEAEQEFYKNSIAFAHEYALALNEQVRLQHTSNKFVTDYSSQINDAFTSLVDANNKYNEAIEKLAEGKAKVDLRDSVDWNATLKTTAMGAAAGAAIGSVIPVIGTAIGAVVGAVGGFFVGLFGGRNKTDVKEGLLDVFPELVTSAGELNRELAQTLINTDQVDESTKQLLQNALDWADAVDAAREQILNIVADLAGDIGNNMRTAIVEAWRAGEDAADRMFDAASKSLENFITNLLYSKIFADIFDEFGDRLAASLDPLAGDQDVLDDYEWLMREMQAKNDLFLQYLDAIRKRAQELGFTGFGSSGTEDVARKATSKGMQGASQDSVTEMNGRLTALLIYQNSINTSVGSINMQLISGLTILGNIERNTEYCRFLEQMQADVALMKADLSSINTRGVNVKTA